MARSSNAGNKTVADGPSRAKEHGAPPALRALLIDDEAPSLLPVLAQGLQPHGFDVFSEAEPERALEAIASNKPDVVLLDLHFPGDSIRTTGARLLTEIRRQFASLPVVVFTTRLDDLTIPVDTFDEKPHGYIAKPKFGRNREWPVALSQSLRDAIDAARYAKEVSDETLGLFIGNTPEMRDAAAQIRIAARNSLPVVIFGESGTGKKTVAEAIHRLSGRPGRFEHCRVSGMQAETLDLALFGERGPPAARTNGSSAGLCILADEGTLFLDEIEKIPDELQSHLVTLIEAGAFRGSGATEGRSLDVRLIVATNHSLADLVAEGLLREDLAYRVQGTMIALPPLRTRRADLPSLFERFVAEANRATKRHVLTTLRPETLSKLDQHSWPGNIRELETTILRSVAHTSANVLLPEDITFAPIAGWTRAERSTTVKPPVSSQTDGPDVVASLTKQLESLSLGERYDFLKGLGEALRKPVLEMFICRLRQKLGKRVGHKELATELAPAEDKSLDTIRQFIITSCNVKLTQLECNH